ncbi:hypothetical protein QAD02_013213 [Eretmocerus hayati]|uniref:Uncharacterized protein n=1 Tax=Eretmocerus hayati TaxID=131215 RepID=A0ACC2P3N4_9HYME|nr:hypothetical protein QAD02_013213 [Eretmocerus hayati]
MGRRRGMKLQKVKSMEKELEVTGKEDNETLNNENYDEIDVVAVDDPHSNPRESSNLEIEEAAAKAIEHSNQCELAIFEIKEAAAKVIEQANTWAGAVQIPSKPSAPATILRSATRRFEEKEWTYELQAAEELAERGYASQLSGILKHKNNQEQAAGSTAKSTAASRYQPKPVGTPRLRPIPIGVPIRTFLRQPMMPFSTMGQVDCEPWKLSMNQGGASCTITAKINANTNSTNSYNRPITSGIKRSFNPAMNPIFKNKFTEFDQRRNNTEEQHIWINQNSRSLFTATTTRNKRCVGPADGVPVGKIPTNPWVAPQNNDQRRFLSAILDGKLKIGLLKARDGRPEKYNAWIGWIGHEVLQIGVLDEFQKSGFVIICSDCGQNPVSPTVLDDCTDAIITCIRHWDDVSNGTIMKTIPMRVDCFCSWMSAKKLKPLE